MKNKDKKTLFNLTGEWISNIVIVAAQFVILVVMVFFANRADEVFWIIFGMLAVSDVFFIFMLVYKIYRSRLTLVTVAKTELVYRNAFAKTVIAAEDLVVALCDTGKPGAVIKYAKVYDKNAPDEGFIMSISMKNTLKKIADYAPRILLIFVIACTQADVLQKMKETASEELARYIDEELEARAENERLARKKRKRKKR